MLKFCKSICKAFYIIFKSCLTQYFFSSEWKAVNVLTQKKKKKKKDKQCLKDYIPVSLVPICSKVFESIILYNTMFPYITLNHLISENQSELKVEL